MRKILVVCLLATIALRAVAALTVTATNGVESLTLTFDAAADARELWVAWDDADKGAGFADWAESERVAIVAADETSLTVALPAFARPTRGSSFSRAAPRIPARSSAAPAPSASTRVSTRRPKPRSPSTRSWRIPAR